MRFNNRKLSHNIDAKFIRTFVTENFFQKYRVYNISVGANSTNKYGIL